MQPTEQAFPGRRLAWQTADIRPSEQFAYYREAVCQAFMKLTPEWTSTAGFDAIASAIARLARTDVGERSLND